MRLIERARQLTSHQFVRRAAVFQFANGIASVLQSIAGVVLARVLKPELFGQYSLAFSVAAVASIILASGIQDALMPIISRNHAAHDSSGVLTGFSYWLKWIGVSVICVAVIVLVLPLLTMVLYHNASIGVLAAVVLVASLVSSSLLSITQVAAQVSGRITTLSWLTLGELVVRNGMAVVLILLGFGSLGAVTGHLIGALLMAVVAWFVFVGLTRKDSLLPSISAMIHRTRSVPWNLHFSQSAWVWVDRNLGMLYQAFPVAMVGLAVPVVSVAYFKLAFGYVNTGMALLGPLSILLNTEFARMQVQNPERLRHNFIRISLVGMGLAGGVTVCAAIAAHWVFQLVYGSAYMASVPLVYGLVAYGTLFGLGIGLGPMWRIVGKVRVSVVINILVLGIGVPLGIIFSRVYGVWGAVVMVTAWYAVSHLASFFYLIRALKSRE